MSMKPSLWWLDLGEGRFAMCGGMTSQQATATAHRLGLGTVLNADTASPVPPHVRWPEEQHAHDCVLPPAVAAEIRALW